MQTTRLTALLITASLVGAACGADVAVTAERYEPIGSVTTTPPFEATPADPPSTIQPDDPTPTTQPAVETPGTTDSPTTTDDTVSTTDQPVETTPAVVDDAAIDFGADKPPQPYDEFLLATLTDLDNWWAETYPLIYGEPWRPLEGDVYAAYPSRDDDLPGCGQPSTSYQDVQQFVAFYCGIGDFIVYDDGDDGLLAELADNFGAGTIGIVLAHEYGHAIQQRSGVLTRNLPTVTTEQQSDCFAGAWAARAKRGEGGIEFSDADVRAGLIAMLEVRDPVGIDPLTPGGHGAGFDRVGAFQTGFDDGPVRCGELIDDPLPLVPNQFTGQRDFDNEGNAPFGYEPFDPDMPGNAQLFGFLVPDLNLFWGTEVAIPGFEDLVLVPVQNVADATCTDRQPGLENGAALCPSSNTVFLNEPVALDLYRQKAFGDFSLGYLIGVAWAEAAQNALGSDLTGEARVLADDCLAGAWVQTVIPVDNQLPTPRAEGRTSLVSPGDLDEAIRTAILIGDLGENDDLIGSPFEKIDAFRSGVLGGIDACAIG